MLRRRRLAPGTEIYRQGEGAGDFAIVGAGWVGLYKLLPGGGRQVLKFALPGDLIGFSATGAGERDHMAVALTEVTVCFGGRALTQQLLRDPAAMTRITGALLAEQAAMCDQLIQIARRPALQRVAHVLADLFTRIQGLPPRDGAEIDLPLTQEQIGDYLGLTAIHVNRMLAQLRRAGAAAVRRRKLRILNAQRLLTLAEGEYQAAPRARRVEHLAAAA